MNSEILVCGEALIDLVPLQRDGETLYRPLAGGSPFNVACGLGRLGAPAAFLTYLSQDPNGELLFERLRAAGVNGTLLQRGPAPTALAYVFAPQPGSEDVRYSFYFAGTSESALDASRIPDPLPEGIEHLHFGSISTVLDPHAGIFQALAAREHGRRLISFDINARPTVTRDREAVLPRVAALLARADIVKASDADLDWLYPGVEHAEVARQWLAGGASLVLLTYGGDGARVLTPAAAFHQQAPRVKVVDTVGAGDTFLAASLWGLWRRGVLTRAGRAGWSEPVLREVADLAVRAAAFCCERPGASVPSAADLGIS